MNRLIESALLTHGSLSVSTDRLGEIWDGYPAEIVWMEKGRIVIGDMDRFLSFRYDVLKSGRKTGRLNHFNLDAALDDDNMADAAMTASGAVSVCAREGIEAAVTAGIGGFFPGELVLSKAGSEEAGLVPAGKRTPPDLATLEMLPVTLISSGPKDMLDYGGTIRYLADHGVTVRGLKRDIFTGYLFVGEPAQIPDSPGRGAASAREAVSAQAGRRTGGALLINEIPEEKRVSDRSILLKAVAYAEEAEKNGAYYHPAVNAKIDELTDGYSAELQLRALLVNARVDF